MHSEREQETAWNKLAIENIPENIKGKLVFAKDLFWEVLLILEPDYKTIYKIKSEPMPAQGEFDLAKAQKERVHKKLLHEVASVFNHCACNNLLTVYLMYSANDFRVVPYQAMKRKESTQSHFFMDGLWFEEDAKFKKYNSPEESNWIIWSKGHLFDTQSIDLEPLASLTESGSSGYFRIKPEDAKHVITQARRLKDGKSLNIPQSKTEYNSSTQADAAESRQRAKDYFLSLMPKEANPPKPDGGMEKLYTDCREALSISKAAAREGYKMAVEERKTEGYNITWNYVGRPINT